MPQTTDPYRAPRLLVLTLLSLSLIGLVVQLAAIVGLTGAGQRILQQLLA